MSERFRFFGPKKDVVLSSSEDTKPITPLSQFEALLFGIDAVQLRFNGDYNKLTGVIVRELRTDDLLGLSDEAKVFLGVSGDEYPGDKLTLSLYHGGGSESWIALSNKVRRLKVVLSLEEQSCRILKQERSDGNWAGKKALPPHPDSEELLGVITKLIN